MLRLLLVTLLSVVAGCTATGGAPPAGDWIDVPLSPETWWSQQGAWQQGEYEIPVAAGRALEYKIGMNAGDMVVYSWAVTMADPALLGVEFHGHTERVGEAPGTVMFYKIHSDGTEQGSLRAPFTGIHGWYLDNQSDEDVVVRLQLAGFYTLLDE
jgi:hypothetical protein